MAFVHKEPRRPVAWRQFRWRVRNPLATPFLFVEWLSQWAAWYLGRWVFLEVLEYCGTLSILVGVIFYFAGARDRREQRHFQAWQVINTAQGKGGNGGRIDALQDLNGDGVPLVAVDLSGDAYLQNINLARAELLRADISRSDMRGANLRGADMALSELVYTNFRGANLGGAKLSQADLTNADLTGADLGDAALDEANLSDADLSGILNWKSIRSVNLANINGCKNAPEGFRDWALANGAVEYARDADWQARIAAAHGAR